jgi:hypothetical protein
MVGRLFGTARSIQNASIPRTHVETVCTPVRIITSQFCYNKMFKYKHQTINSAVEKPEGFRPKHIESPPTLPTHWSRALLKKLIVAHRVKKYPTVYGIQMFISMFTRASPWAFSLARWISTLRSILMLSFHCSVNDLCLCSVYIKFGIGFKIKVLFMYLKNRGCRIQFFIRFRHVALRLKK